MGIVAKALWRSRLGPDWRLRAAGDLFARAAGGQELFAAICVDLQSWSGRHSRWERLIGSAVPVQALLSAVLGPSTITVGVSGMVMTCHRRMAEGCRSVARLRSAAWRHRSRDRGRSRLRWACDRLWSDCRQPRRHQCHGHRAADDRERGCRRGRHWRASRSGGCGDRRCGVRYCPPSSV